MDFLKWFRTQWDRTAAAVLAVLGLVVLLLGYLGASGTPYPAEQLPYMISGGVLGIFLLGGAAALYVSADLRDEWRKLNSIDMTLKQLAGTTTRDQGVLAEDPAETSARADEPETGPTHEPAPRRRPAAATTTPTKAAPRRRRTAETS